MSMFTESEARTLLEKVIGLSKADECSATLQGGREGNVRFARNAVSTSGVVDSTQLVVQVAFGNRTGVATANSFDDAALQAVVARAEELARLAPENPEFMPAIEKQQYKPTATYVETTAAIDPEFRAQVAADCILPCKEKDLVAAGFFIDSQGFTAVANSKGNFGYQRTTGADLTCTVRTSDEQGPGSHA